MSWDSDKERAYQQKREEGMAHFLGYANANEMRDAAIYRAAQKREAEVSRRQAELRAQLEKAKREAEIALKNATQEQLRKFARRYESDSTRISSYPPRENKEEQAYWAYKKDRRMREAIAKAKADAKLALEHTCKATKCVFNVCSNIVSMIAKKLN